MSSVYPTPDREYKLVILCWTYNQHLYLSDALNGFVTQKTDFPYIALIIDDCSTDGNQEIIRKYEQKYPDKIRGIYLKENFFSQKKSKDPIIEPWVKSVKYIAGCEGDDYWTDPNKLQRQVDFLDAHPDYMLCFHNALVKWENHEHKDSLISEFETGDFNTELIFRKWQLPYASFVYRSELTYTDEYINFHVPFKGGFALLIVASMVGRVYGFSECLSVYRKNDGGIARRWSIAHTHHLNYEHAIASKDNAAIEYEITNICNSLTHHIKGYILRHKDSVELKKLADSINPCLFYKALVKYTFAYPIRKLRLVGKFLLIIFLGMLVGYISIIIDKKWPIIKTYVFNYSLLGTSCEESMGGAKLREACIQLIKDESWGNRVLYEAGLLQDIRNSISCLQKSISVWEYGEYAYLLHYCLLYAENTNDKEITDLIKTKFDHVFKDDGVESIVRNDQVAYGNVAIDLYRITKETFYKNIADEIYHRLDSIKNQDGLILYREWTDEQHVDAIGIVCPFLSYYSKVFACKKAEFLCEKMINEYIQWGTDENTGIPVQTYNVKSHVKYNKANWGRGISWFLHGVLGLDRYNDKAKERITKLESTLMMDNDKLYNQYFGQGGHADMSATIPVVYYLHEKGLFQLNKTQYKRILSNFMDKEGNLCWGSPSIAFPEKKVNENITNLWCQGLALYLYSKLQ